MTLITNQAVAKQISDALNLELGAFSSETFEVLIRSHASNDVNVSLPFDWIPITLAAHFNNNEAIKYLLERDPPGDMNAKIGWGNETLLSNAVKTNNIELIKVLVAHAATVDFNVCLSAAASGNIDIVSLLLPHIKWTPTQTQLDELLIKSIAENATLDIVKSLLDLGASPSAKRREKDDPDDVTALIAALLTNKLDIFKWLIEKGADVEASNNLLIAMKKRCERLLCVHRAIKEKVDGNIAFTDDPEPFYALVDAPYEKDFKEVVEVTIINANWGCRRGQANQVSVELLEKINTCQTDIDRFEGYISNLSAGVCSGVEVITEDSTADHLEPSAYHQEKSTLEHPSKSSPMSQSVEQTVDVETSTLAQGQNPSTLEHKHELRTLAMFFNDPLQDGVDLAKQLKPMNYYEILQLNQSFFENFDETTFKKHMKKLCLFYHPDKNATNSEKAKIVFQAIGDASECMRDSNRRVHYVKTGVDSQSGTTDQEADHVSSGNWWQDYIDETLDALNEIEIRAEALSETGSNALVIPGDNFEKVCGELHSLWRERLVRNDVYAKQREVFKAVKEAAKTGADFYNLSKLMGKMTFLKIQLNDGTIYSVRDCFQDAARLKHPESMRSLAGSALSGLLTPYAQSIPWAIKCIIYLEQVVVPELRTSNAEKDVESLDAITRGIGRAKERIKGLLPGEAIPTPGSARFDQVLAQTIKSLPKEGSLSYESSTFTLSDDVFGDWALLSTLKHEGTAALNAKDANNTQTGPIHAQSDAQVGENAASKHVSGSDDGASSESSTSSSQQNVFSAEDKTIITTALTDSINTITMWGGPNASLKVNELVGYKNEILWKLSTPTDRSSIIADLKVFAEKANEYRLIKKTTASFTMFKSRIGTILSADEITSLETGQKHYKPS